MNDFDIRRAVGTDTEALSFLVLSSAEERASAECDQKMLRAVIVRSLATPGHEIWVAVAKGDLLGYAAVHWIPFPLLHGTEGYLSDLLVARDARGRGGGRRLLAEVERRAREFGCARLMLNNARTAESYARGFYPKEGYRERTEFANFVKRLDQE